MQASNNPKTELMTLSTRHDLTRNQIIERFRQRINVGDRTKLSRDELGQLALHFLDRLIQLNQQGQDSETAIAQLASAEIDLLEEGYPRQSISSQYLSTYRRLILEAIEAGKLTLTEQNSYLKHWQKLDGSDSGTSREHYALKHLKYDQATYQTLRQSTTANNNRRQDSLQVIPLQRYLGQVISLLEAEDERLLAIAIAALTGRRHTEVISKGSFELTAYPYALHFSGQQKKAQSLSFDILTLIPAKDLLPAIERFRQLKAIAPLVESEAAHDDPRIDALNTRINRQVRKYFQQTEIVPVPEGFKTVSIHRLRGIYGAIAIHFFCPEWQHEHRFLQHYLGHVLEGKVTPNSRATDHYFHYRLARPNGELIRARGVKIAANGLPPLPSETPSSPEPAPLTQTTMPPANTTQTSLYTSDVDRLHKLAAQLGEHGNSAEALRAVLGQAEASWKQQQQTPQLQPDALEAIAHQAATLRWLTTELETLRAENKQLKQQVDSAGPNEPHQKLTKKIEHLQQQNAQLQQQLQQFDAIRQAFLGTSTQAPPQTQETQQSAGSSTQPTLEPQPEETRANSAKDRAKAIFNAISQWNQQHPDDTYAINAGLLEREFGINRKAAKTFMDEEKDAIEQLHQIGGVDNPSYHNRGKDSTEQFVKFVEKEQT